MKRLTALFLATVFIISCFSGCTSIRAKDLLEDITKGPSPSLSEESYDKSCSGIMNFSVELFKNFASGSSNVLISPLSVISALAMTANGAAENTLAQMEDVFGLTVQELNSFVYSYMDSLPTGEKYRLHLANSIWYRDDERLTVEESFLQAVSDYYGAGAYKAAFDESTRRDINNWVEDKTDGMIRDILDSISRDAVMYLVNALSFEAEWQSIYENYQVRSGIFTTEKGEKRTADLMFSTENMYLSHENGAGFIKYYKDRKFAFAALLPNSGISLADYVSSLDGEELSIILANAEQTPVTTAIPKFECSYDTEMGATLQEMGMTDAFSEVSADFSKMGKSAAGNIFISRVIHKTYISVFEKGTKAGASTVVEMTDGASSAPPENEVILDRPFVYMIIDCETNIPIFIGSLTDTEK